MLRARKTLQNVKVRKCAAGPYLVSIAAGLGVLSSENVYAGESIQRPEERTLKVPAGKERVHPANQLPAANAPAQAMLQELAAKSGAAVH